MPRNPNKTPAWAIRGSDPPRCSPHRHAAAYPEPIPSEAAGPGPTAHPEPSLSKAEGPYPTAFADSASGVGAPPGNQNRLVHGFYAKVLRPEERADLEDYAADTTLDAEIAITRVALHRIYGMLLTGTTPDPRPLNAQDYARFASLAFRGAGAVSRLLRARQVLSPELSDAFTSAMNQALDELSAEWGVVL